MKRATGIRVQLSVATAAIVMVIVAVAGVAVAVQIDQQDRAQLDAAMRDRSSHIEGDLDKILRGTEPGLGRSSPDPYGDLLGASQSLVRVIVNGQAAVQRGQIPATPLPLPRADGFASLTVDGPSWRSFVRTSGVHNEIQLQVLQDLQPLVEWNTRNKPASVGGHRRRHCLGRSSRMAGGRIASEAIATGPRRGDRDP